MTGETARLEIEVHRWALELESSEAREQQIAARIRHQAPLLDADGQRAVVQRVLDRLEGLGPLEVLLTDPEISEVMVNGPGPVWVERSGSLEQTDLTIDADALGHAIERIVAPLGRRLDRTSPLVDGRLADGSRVHVAAPPVALDGPYLTIRRFRALPVALSDMAPAPVVALLRWAVDARCNVVVSGGTGSGKTTLLNALAAVIDRSERVVTIEDAAELRMGSGHVVRLEARPQSVDGPPAVTIRELVRNALRMRPDRIVVGEVRGDEALDMTQAMNTGHDGSMSTCHANTAADALQRLAAMIVMEGSVTSTDVADRLVASAVDLVVHVERTASGARRVAEVAEPVAGMRRVRVLWGGTEGVVAPTRRGVRGATFVPVTP
jgi:pilus assembly protein CpaF